MLDEAVTEKILSKLALTYGARFHELYAGLDAGMVRRNWAKELDGVSREGVEYAFANLPERFPPNVLEFRKLCQGRRTEASQLRLPPPKAAGMSQEARQRLAAAMAAWRQRNADPKAWARRLRARELACEPLTTHQRAMWRSALNEPTPSSEDDQP